jgi:hypothetical protein
VASTDPLLEKLLEEFQSPHDRDILLSALKVAVDASVQEGDPGQIHDVPTIDKWLNSRYYLGPYASSMYPFWKKEIADFAGNNKNEWVVTGSIGTGKSTAGIASLLWKLTYLSSFKHPQRLFKLADPSRIFFAYLSVSQNQAEITGFAQLRDMIDASPYFREKCPRDKSVDSILRFPDLGIYIVSGSNALSVIGTNLLCCLFDEANFARDGGSSKAGSIDKAQDIYKEITDRRRSRFLRGGVDPGFSILVSSSTTQSSFTESRIKLANFGTKVTSAALWDAKPQGTYSNVTFPVFIGNERDDPFIVNDPKDLIQLMDELPDLKPIRDFIAEGELSDPSKAVDLLPVSMQKAFVRVPLDFRASFEDNIIKGLRNIAGVSTSPTGRLFTSYPIWNASCKPELKHPFTKAEVSVGLKTHGAVIDYFIPSVLFNADGTMVRHPDAHRYVHIDQSVANDSTGIAIVHLAGWAIDTDTLLRRPIIETDLLLAIKPPPAPDRLSIAKVRQFIFHLREMGMPIAKVSTDQFQSEDNRQILESNGIPTERISVDADDQPYITVCDLLYDSRIHQYEYPILRQEFMNLEHDRDRKKVDHPDKNPDGTKGSKDVSDALAGSVHALLHALAKNPPADRMALMDAVRVESESGREEFNENWFLPKNIFSFVESDDESEL